MLNMKQRQTKQKKQDSNKNPLQQTGHFQSFSKLTDHSYLEAQGIIGNHGILSRHSGDIIQSKLKIGQPNEKYEQEADRVANLVMNLAENQLVGRNITKINHAVQGKRDGGEVSPGHNADTGAYGAEYTARGPGSTKQYGIPRPCL
jgi:hypothetical protein